MLGKAASVLLAILAVGVVACGDASKTLSAGALRTQAGAVCRDVSREILALQARASQATMRASLARAATVLDDGIARLRALEPPQQLAGRYADFVAWERSRRDAAVELSKGGRMSARSRRAVEAHHSPVRTLAQQLGIPACT